MWRRGEGGGQGEREKRGADIEDGKEEEKREENYKRRTLGSTHIYGTVQQRPGLVRWDRSQLEREIGSPSLCELSDGVCNCLDSLNLHRLDPLRVEHTMVSATQDKQA